MCVKKYKINTLVTIGTAIIALVLNIFPHVSLCRSIAEDDKKEVVAVMAREGHGSTFTINSKGHES